MDLFERLKAKWASEDSSKNSSNSAWAQRRLLFLASSPAFLDLSLARATATSSKIVWKVCGSETAQADLSEYIEKRLRNWGSKCSLSFVGVFSHVWRSVFCIARSLIQLRTKGPVLVCNRSTGHCFQVAEAMKMRKSKKILELKWTGQWKKMWWEQKPEGIPENPRHEGVQTHEKGVHFLKKVLHRRYSFSLKMPPSWRGFDSHFPIFKLDPLVHRRKRWACKAKWFVFGPGQLSSRGRGNFSKTLCYIRDFLQGAAHEGIETVQIFKQRL